MKIVISIVAILLLSVVGFAETKEKSTVALSETALNKYQYCGSDADCIVVRNGCCDCEAFAAINKEHQKAFEAEFDCLKASCPTTNPTSCAQGVVSCVEHKCRRF